MQRISILGCGWLGFPLAKRLVTQGHQIKGSTTSREKITRLEKEGIQGFQLKLTEDGIEGDIREFLSEAELLIIDIPPGLRRNPESDFTKKIKVLLREIEKTNIKNVLFISSTSVFEDTAKVLTYTEIEEPNGQKVNALQLITAEKMLTQSEAFTGTILRFGGLFGADRHPVNHLAGRNELGNRQAPINLIHRNDCIALIEKIIERQNWQPVFHGVFPFHPSKEKYYTQVAMHKKLKQPQFNFEKESTGKIISSVQTQEILDFRFQFKP